MRRQPPGTSLLWDFAYGAALGTVNGLLSWERVRQGRWG